MSELADQVNELLEEYRAVGDQFWQECEERAEAMVHAAVSAGEVSDLRGLGKTREALKRQIGMQKILDFAHEHGFPDEQIERILLVRLSDTDIRNLDDGVAPSFELIEDFRIRTLLVHFAMGKEAMDSASELVEGH